MLKRIRETTDKLLNAAIIVLFLTMFGVTTLNVICRYVFNSPLIFAVELGRYTFTGIVYLGSIFVMREDGHIGLDIIVDILPEKLRNIVRKVARVIVLCYIALFFYESCRMVMGNWANRSSTMGIPMSIIYLVMVIGSAGIFVEEFLLLIGYHSDETTPAKELGGGM